MLNRHARHGIPDGKPLPHDPRQLFQSLVEDEFVVSDADWARVEKHPPWMTTLSFLQLALHSDAAARGTASDLLHHPFLAACPH